MTPIIKRLPALAIAATLQLGCAESGVERHLPAIHEGEALCTPSEEVTLSMLEWAARYDNVISGRVEKLSASSSPAWVANSSADPRVLVDGNDCEGEFAHALRIHLIEVEGAAPGTPDRVSVTLGVRVLEDWLPFPLISDDEVTWPGEGGAILPGMKVGGPVRFFEESGISTFGRHPLWRVDENGRIRLQERESPCGGGGAGPTASLLEGVAWADVRAEVGASVHVLGSADEEGPSSDHRVRDWYGAFCYPEPQTMQCLPETELYDCLEGERCIDGSCQPVD